MMITLLLTVFNIILWVWLIGFLFTIPVMVRHIFANEDSFTVAYLLFIPFSASLWFLQLEDIVEELEEAFGFDCEELLEKVLEYELFKIR